jgi:lipoprotein-anchoring transpeptidase ErfK/SrfK
MTAVKSLRWGMLFLLSALFVSTGFVSAGLADEASQLLSPEHINAPPVLPVAEDDRAAIVHIQILLDRVNYSPGIIDGKWGPNTERALYWYQRTRKLEATGRVDRTTYEALRAEAGRSAPLIVYEVRQLDLEGPFVSVPPRNYQRKDLDWIGYRSLLEMLSERFHTSSELLMTLNPDVDFDAVEVGQLLHVPYIEVMRMDEFAEKTVHEVVVVPNENYLHALDADGEILFHFPITLGDSYDPDRFERLTVEVIAYAPEFYYQPELHGGPAETERAVLAPGPNSVVGLVWIGLDEPGYGIHGTQSPETIGYATSLGCVRLTNWDAIRLANHLSLGTPVVFRHHS